MSSLSCPLFFLAAGSLLVACSGSVCGDSAPIAGSADVLVSSQSQIGGVVELGDGTDDARGSFGDDTLIKSVLGASASGVEAYAFDALVTGRMTDDGAGVMNVSVDGSVGGEHVLLALAAPDARFLADGEARSTPATLTITDAAGCRFDAVATATTTVRHAVGSDAPAPRFVTADFERDLDLALTVAPADFTAPRAGCAPPSVTFAAALTLDAASYVQSWNDTTGCVPSPDIPFYK